MQRLVFGLALGLVSALVLAAEPTAAQIWPQRPVRFIVTLGAGSGVDIGTRLIADRLARRWGQPVVVENRPGGDGLVAISAFVGANDDHVLLAAPPGTGDVILALIMLLIILLRPDGIAAGRELTWPFGRS
ncbi:MAG: hypothetical protein E6G78_09025 [Alphaproteobacteria bacterium]|nr:MAG: hypothetical protein E6G78_09025 [Alphaproteobacteria bacterium]